MRSAGVIAGLAAAALAILVLLWFQRAEHGGRSDREPTETVRAPLAALLEPADVPQAASEVPTRPIENAQRDALDFAAALAPTCLVRVVQKGSGASVPDACLWIQREDVDPDGPEWWRAMLRFDDVETVLAGGFGREVALDGRGEARVPRPARVLAVAAARGSLHGTADLWPGTMTCVVELEPYHELTVEVVDRAGRAVPHALVVFFWGEFDPLDDSNVLPADEQGRLTIRKLEDQIRGRGPVRIALAGGLPCEPELVEFTLASVPHEPIRFVAGDFGSVVVQLTDPQGREVAQEGTAYFEIYTDRLADPGLGLRAGASLDLPLEEGRALFSCIGLGLPLEIGCAARGYDSAWRDVSGPSTPGEEVRVLIPVGERYVIARGRVVGAPDEGLLEAQSPLPWVGFQVRIGGDGAFECDLGTEDTEQLEGPWFVRFQRRDEPALGATLVPLVDAEELVVDLGEIRLEPLAALARLRVVDDGGAPVASASIESRPASDSRLPDRRWTDEHGACLLEGPATDLPVRARATHDDWLASEWLQITALESEATLVLRRGATLEGRLLLPQGANLEWLELELSPEVAVPGDGSPEYESPQHDEELVEGGRFRFQGCEPGLARLIVTYDDSEVTERTGIELLAGRTTELPEIDLRAELHPFTLSFELANGTPWLGGHLEVCEADGDTSSWTTIGPSGRASLFSPHPSLDVWVAGRGARATLFEGVHDGDRLVLPDAPSIVLRLPHELPLPAPPLALVVFVERTEPEEVPFETDDDVDGADFVVGPDGLVRLSAPWPGAYALSWSLRHTGTGAEFDIEREVLQTVTIDQSSAATIVEAILTPAEVARAELEAAGD